MSEKRAMKVVLAYSGGLDTSVILKWLQTAYGAEVVTFTADLGQGEELGPAKAKAELLGVKPENIFVEDVREEFVRDYVFPMFRANALYEGAYLLGTSIARPLIAKKQIEIAKATGADAVAHGATGKGNDQVRFELAYYAFEPDIKVIAPWREWDLTSRTRLLDFAEAHQIPIAKDKRGEAPFSVDANLLHSSSEAKALEDPGAEPETIVYQRTLSPEDAPDRATVIEIGFERPRVYGLAAFLFDWRERDQFACRNKICFLGELAARGGQRIVAGLGEAFWNGPHPDIFFGPKRAAGMNEEDQNSLGHDFVRQQSGAALRHYPNLPVAGFSSWLDPLRSIYRSPTSAERADDQEAESG